MYVIGSFVPKKRVVGAVLVVNKELTSYSSVHHWHLLLALCPEVLVES